MTGGDGGAGSDPDRGAGTDGDGGDGDGRTDAAPTAIPGVEDPVDGALQGDATNLTERVDRLYEQARAAREAFEAPAEPEERALAYCRQGLWPVLAVYVDRRGAGAPLGQPHHDRLEAALNTWLELYARCYGVDVAPAVSVREAAELFVSTHDVLDVAQLLTDVPDRRER